MNAATRAGATTGALALLAQYVPGALQLRPVRLALAPRLAGLGRADHVALTFDDGPDPASTPRFLAALAGRGVRATFFMLGSMAARHPSVAAEVAAAGHEVALHGHDHTNLLLRGPRATRRDLARGRAAVEAASGARVHRYRPPYGVLSGSGLASCRLEGLTPVLWSAWGRDWTPAATGESVARTVAGQLSPGATVLLHDSDCTSTPGSWRATLGALDAVLDAAAALGATVGPLADHALA